VFEKAGGRRQEVSPSIKFRGFNKGAVAQVMGDIPITHEPNP